MQCIPKLAALVFAWNGRVDNAAQEIVRQTGAAKASASATLPRATATRSVAAVSPTDASNASESFEPAPWVDPLDAEFESTRAYAGEVEHRWRTRSDRWSNLEEQVRQLQAEWNATAL